MEEITELFIKVLNDEVMHWQKVAVKASSEGRDKDCRDALDKQAVAVDNLIKLASQWGKNRHA